MKIKIEFGGGMETITRGNVRALELDLDNAAVSTARDLLRHVKETYVLPHKSELFMQGETIRPGVLVLINDCDWEIENGLEYQLRDNDEIAFISTLHGG